MKPRISVRRRDNTEEKYNSVLVFLKINEIKFKETIVSSTLPETNISTQDTKEEN